MRPMSTTKSYESVTIERDGPIAEVILSGPGKGNAMGPAFFRELPEVFTELDRDDAVRAIVLRGKGGVFTYGLDLKAVAPTLMPLLDAANLAKERTQLLRLDWIAHGLLSVRTPVGSGAPSGASGDRSRARSG